MVGEFGPLAPCHILWQESEVIRYTEVAFMLNEDSIGPEKAAHSGKEGVVGTYLSDEEIVIEETSGERLHEDSGVVPE